MMKIFFRNIHLYLGLASGLVIMVTCFTGAALVFEKELQASIYPERYKVEKGNEPVSIEQLVKKLQGKVPGATVTSVKIYTDPLHSVELSYAEKKKEGEKRKPESRSEQKSTVKTESNRPGPGAPGAKPGPGGPGGGPGGGSTAFMNPYTGELISLYSYRNTFFFTMFSLHRWLLAGDAGKMIVGICTFIFLFILITGIILWWPKNTKKLKQGVTLKLKAGWKRVNHDLHITIGFYSAIFLFIFAFTGLAWSFEWFNKGIYWITGTENKRPEPPFSTYQSSTRSISFDEALAIIRKEAPDVQYYTLNAPRDSASAFTIMALAANPVHEKASDSYFLDQYSGKLIGTALYKDRNLGQRTRSAFYSWHVGSVAGLPGRIIAFLACIAGATFPVTGVILWINRLNKEKKKARKAVKSTRRSNAQGISRKDGIFIDSPLPVSSQDR